MPMQAPGRDLPLSALLVCWLAETKLVKSWAAADSFDMHGVSKNPASPAEMCVNPRRLTKEVENSSESILWPLATATTNVVCYAKRNGDISGGGGSWLGNVHV